MEQNLSFGGVLEEIQKSIIAGQYPNARRQVSDAIEIAKTQTELLPSVLSKKIVLDFLLKRDNQTFLQDLKLFLSKIPDNDKVWEQTQIIIIDDITGFHGKIRYRLTSDFYSMIQIFPQMVIKISSDDSLSFESLEEYTNILSLCEKSVSSSILTSFMSASIKKVCKWIESLDEKGLRSVDEKKLRKLFMYAKKHLISSEIKILNNFEYELAFRFVLSPYLSKQLDGLIRFNSYNSFSNDTINRINEHGVVKKIMENIHPELVEQFCMFLSIMWKMDHYDSNILVNFWNISIQQHSSDIDKFFKSWPFLFSKIPGKRKNDFWDLVKEMKTFPKGCLSFLKEISSYCPNSIKTPITAHLWEDSHMSEDFVTIICSYCPTEETVRLQYFNECYDMLLQNIHEKFALSIMNNLWIPKNPKDDFHNIVKNVRVMLCNLSLMFDLLMKIANYMVNSISNEDMDFIKEIISPAISKDIVLATSFIQCVSKLFNNEASTNMLDWLSGFEESHGIVIYLFKRLNQIKINSNLFDPTLIGIDSLWKLAIEFQNIEICEFLVDMALETYDPSTILKFVNKCLDSIQMIGSLKLLGLLIHKFEDHLDFDVLSIKRNQYIPSENRITIQLTGDLNTSIKIVKGTNTETFKKICSRMAKTSLSSIAILYNKELLPRNHIFVQGQSFEIVKSFSFTSYELTIDPCFLPSRIIQKSPQFPMLKELLDSENKDLAKNALNLLNLCETDPQIDHAIRSGSETIGEFSLIYDPDREFTLLYRLNCLCSIIEENNRSFIISFIQNGGFSKLIKILFSIDTNSYSSPYLNMLVYWAVTIFYKASNIDEANSKIEFVIKQNGLSQGIMTVADWILNLICEKQSVQLHLIDCVAYILSILVFYQKQSILEYPKLKLLFQKSLFHHRKEVSTSLFKVFSVISPLDIEEIILGSLTESISCYCSEYFYLLKSLSEKCSQPDRLWDDISTFLRDNIYHININFTYIIGEEEGFDVNESNRLINFVKSNNSNIAKPSFVSGMIMCMNVLFSRISSISDRMFNETSMFLFDQIAFNIYRYIPTPDIIYTLIENIIRVKPDTRFPIIESLGLRIESYTPPSMNKRYYNPLESQVSYRGLNNMGCTCYLNSSIQQVFFIKPICESILEFMPVSYDFSDWTFQIQQLFSKLLFAPVSSVDPVGFVTNWKGWGNRPINPHEQQDAVEFIQSLLDKIDEQLPSKPITMHVKGKIIHHTIGSTKQYSSTSEELFTTFPLEVLGCSNFEDSFKRFLIPDLVSGYNAGDDIGVIDVERHHHIMTLPQYFIIQLKRFDYDMMTGDRKKINTYFSFPLVADFKPLLSADSNDDSEYSLSGIVVHSGSALGGHYYSYILNENTNKWWCFNDSSAYEVSNRPEELIESLAGGSETKDYYDFEKKQVKRGIFDKTSSAYILVYKRTNINIDHKELTIEILPKKSILALHKDIEQMVLYHELRTIPFSSFVCNLSEISGSEFHPLVFSLYIKLLDTNPYDKNTELIHNEILLRINRDSSFSQYLLSKAQVIIDFLVMRNEKKSRQMMVVTIKNCILLLKEDSSGLIDMIIEQIPLLLPYWKNFDDFLQPVHYFLENVSYQKPLYIDKLLNFVRIVIPENVGKTEKDDFNKHANISHVFYCLKLLISNLGKHKDYESIVFDPIFLNTWYSSDPNSFAFSLLIMSFIKDDRERNEEYLKYLSKESDEMPVSVRASHFASIISFEDSYQCQRIEWFFSYLRSKNLSSNRNELDYFIIEVANKLKIFQGNSCIMMIKYHEKWLLDWLFSNESSIRKGCLTLIYAIFPRFPQFEQNQFERYPKIPKTKPDVSISDSENMIQLLRILLSAFSKMVDRSKTVSGILVYKKPTETMMPTNHYFELLAWLVFYGGDRDSIVSMKDQIINAIKVFASLKYNQKGPILDIIHFLSVFGIHEIFNEDNLGVCLSALSNLPQENTDFYVCFMAEECFPLLIMNQKNCLLVPKYTVFQSSLFYSFGDSSKAQNSISTIIQYCVSKHNIVDICIALWDDNVLKNRIRSSDLMYFEETKALLAESSSLSPFLKSQFIDFIMIELDKAFDNQQQCNYTILKNYVTTLTLFARFYVEEYKDQLNLFFFGDMRKFVKKFTSYQSHFPKFMIWIQQSSTPQDFSRLLLDLCSIVLCSDEYFKNIAEGMINTNTEFYSRIHPNLYVDFFHFFYNVIIYHKISPAKHSDLIMNEMIRIHECSASCHEVVSEMIPRIGVVRIDYEKILLDVFFDMLEPRKDIANFLSKTWKRAKQAAGKCQKSAEFCQKIIEVYQDFLHDVELKGIANDNITSLIEFVQTISPH